MDVQAVVFDVFGTVVDWRSGVARDVAAVLGDGVDAYAFADAWRGRYVPSMGRVRRGEQPWTTLDALHRASLDELLGEFGVAGPDERARRELVLAWHRLDPWPDSVAGLTALATRHIVGTFSNGNVRLLVDMAKRVGLPWDVVLCAEIVRSYKPDPALYDAGPELLGLRPDQVVLAAAHVDDLEAARGRGLRTAYVHRPAEFGPHVPAPPERDPAADLNATDIGDLARQLGC